MSPTGVPAIEGWFTTGDAPALVGSRCTTCANVVFPPSEGFCPNPGCRGREVETVELSRTGRIWSYTDARYQPPEPYVPATDPYVPFALAAVQLEAEGLVVLGQLAEGVTVDDVVVGDEVELVVEVLHQIEGTDQLIWRWKPTADPTGSEEAAR